MNGSGHSQHIVTVPRSWVPGALRQAPSGGSTRGCSAVVAAACARSGTGAFALEVAALFFQASPQPGDLLVCPHVLDREGNLSRNTLEEWDVLERVPVGFEAREQYRPDGLIPSDERDDQVRAHSPGKQDLVPRESRLGREIAADARLPMLERPAGGGTLGVDLLARAVRVPRQLLPLQRDGAKYLFSAT